MSNIRCIILYNDYIIYIPVHSFVLNNDMANSRKANYYTSGLDGHGKFRDCSTVKGNEVESVLMKAKKAGKGIEL